MTLPPEPAHELIEILHQEIAHLRRLADVARDERAAIERVTLPAFESVNERRRKTLDLLQVLESRRESILADLARDWGQEGRPVTLAAVVERVGQELGTTLQGQQHELDRLIDAVRQLMAVNRLAMARLTDFVQHTLAVWQPSGGGDVTYSETGTKKASRPSGRVLAQEG